MTQEAAIYEFLNGFGIPAYPASSVPDQAEFPRITYEVVLGEWGGTEVNMPVNVWYRTESEAEPNAKVREISRRIGHGGILIECDDGVLWIKKGSPWAQAVTIDGEDEKVKRRYVNINVETLAFE